MTSRIPERWRRWLPDSRSLRWTCIGLGILTLLAATAAFRGAVPLDARTNAPLSGIDAVLELPVSALAIEPLTAPASIVTGAPDFRVAAISSILWIVALTPFASFFLNAHMPVVRRVLRALHAMTEAALGAALCLFFFLIVPLPGWSPAVKDRNIVIADLHSHTSASRDGLASLDENIAYHRVRGYGVVAITDHFPAVRPAIRAGDALVPGLEVTLGVAERTLFLLVLGAQPQALPPDTTTDAGGDIWARMRTLVDAFHRQGAVVIAASYRMIGGDVRKAKDTGVDAFELVNFGHPDIDDDVRRDLLGVGTALIASSDWHGWGGFARTWTLVRLPDTSGTQAARTLDALHDAARVIPVVSQEIGSPSLMRAVFAPILESIRYARELTVARLASWWLWACALALAAAPLQRRGLQAFRCFAVLALVAIGLCLASRGLVMVSGGNPFGLDGLRMKIGFGGIGAGLGALVWAAVLVYRQRARLRLQPIPSRAR